MQIEVPHIASSRKYSLTEKQGAVSHWYLHSKEAEFLWTHKHMKVVGEMGAVTPSTGFYQQTGETTRNFNQQQVLKFFQSNKKRTKTDLQYCSRPNCFREEQVTHYCQLPCKGAE